MSEAEILEGKFEESLATVPQVAMSVAREPSVVLAEAHRAAKALQEVIESKPKKVTFNGRTYLVYEDWQTIARFYGVSAKVTASDFVEYGDVKGFSARAVVVMVANGIEVSAAEAMCLNDEQNWKSKPLFQLKSMAQTRACAKALRNILGFVPVLAGYEATPSEEMIQTGSQEAADAVAERKLAEAKQRGKSAPISGNGTPDASKGEVTIVAWPETEDGDVEITGSAMTLLNVGAKRVAKDPANRLVKHSLMPKFYDLCRKLGVTIKDMPESFRE